MQTEQQKQIFNIWYKFGIQAKTILELMQGIQINNFDLEQFEAMQLDCETLVKELNDNIAKHLKQFPD